MIPSLPYQLHIIKFLLLMQIKQSIYLFCHLNQCDSRQDQSNDNTETTRQTPAWERAKLSENQWEEYSTTNSKVDYKYDNKEGNRITRQGDKYYRYDRSGRRVITLSSEGTYVYRYNLEGQLARVYFSYKRISVNTTAFDYIYDSYDFAGNGFDLIEKNEYNNSGIRVYKLTPPPPLSSTGKEGGVETLFYQTPFGYLGEKNLTTGKERLLVNYLSSMTAATASFESVTKSFGNADGPSYQSSMSAYNGGQFGTERAVMNQKIPVTQDMQPLGEVEARFFDTSSDVSIKWSAYEASSLTMNTISVASGFDKFKVLNYYRDQIGSVRLVTRLDTDGTTVKSVWRCDYTVYGEILTEDYQMTWLPLKTFALHEYDKETLLYYAQARWYDAETASFTSEDGAQDGLNWYAYCGGSPVGSVDPDGKASILARNAYTTPQIIFGHFNVWYYDSGSNVRQYGSPDRTHENNKIMNDNQYKILYSGMDDKILDKVSNEILNSPAWQVKNKYGLNTYNGLFHNCQHYALTVASKYFEEVRKEYKDTYLDDYNKTKIEEAKIIREYEKKSGVKEEDLTKIPDAKKWDELSLSEKSDINMKVNKDTLKHWKETIKDAGDIIKKGQVDDFVKKDKTDIIKEKKDELQKERNEQLKSLKEELQKKQEEQKNNSPGQTNNDKGSDGESGGNKVICKELHRQGLMDDNTFTADEDFGYNLYQKYPLIIKGYHFWALPVVRLMKESKTITGIVYFFAKPWSEEMAYEMNAREKGNVFGKAEMILGLSICYIIGVVISYPVMAILIVLLALLLILCHKKVFIMKMTLKKCLFWAPFIIVMLLLNGCKTIDYVFNEKSSFTEYIDVLNSINHFVYQYNTNQFKEINKKLFENHSLEILPDKNSSLNNQVRADGNEIDNVDLSPIIEQIKKRMGNIDRIEYIKDAIADDYFWLKNFWLNNRQSFDKKGYNGYYGKNKEVEYYIDMNIYTEKLIKMEFQVILINKNNSKTWIVAGIRFYNDDLFKEVKLKN